MKHRAGFTLMELLVSVVLMLIVLLLLFRAFSGALTAMGETARQNRMDRNLVSALDVMADDLRHSILGSGSFNAEAAADTRWGAWSRVDFVRLRHAPGQPSDLERVSYLWEPSAVETNHLVQLVRVSEPLTNGLDAVMATWPVFSDLSAQREVLIDAATRVDLVLEEYGADLLIATVSEPLAPQAQWPSNWVALTRQLNGTWMHRRVAFTSELEGLFFW